MYRAVVTGDEGPARDCAVAGVLALPSVPRLVDEESRGKGRAQDTTVLSPIPPPPDSWYNLFSQGAPCGDSFCA